MSSMILCLDPSNQSGFGVSISVDISFVAAAMDNELHLC
jgi:hypothetical protein